jgi:beta-galactosidase
VSRGKRFPHTVLKSFVSSGHSRVFWESGGKPSGIQSHCNIYNLTGVVGVPDITQSWKFFLVGSPEAAPHGWEKSSYPLAETWKDMALPSHWQCQGYDVPIYTNTAYPFRFDPPRARRDGMWMQTDCDGFLGGTPVGTVVNDSVGENATGLYRKTFTMPSHWADQEQQLSVRPGREQKWRYFLVFEGVDAAFDVWMNGTYLGYSQDSCLPAEFDITEIVNSHESVEHLICCRVRQ